MSGLVSLLYRADWARLSLTAEVNVTRDRDLWRSRYDDGPPQGVPDNASGPICGEDRAPRFWGL